VEGAALLDARGHLDLELAAVRSFDLRKGREGGEVRSGREGGGGVSLDLWREGGVRES
jgi:hypothetical protein